MNSTRICLSLGILIALSLSTAAQSKPDSTIPKPTAFKLGQVWTMDQDITVTILAVEDVHKVGKIVHVRLDNVPWQSCGGFHLTRSIEHVAVTERMLANSGLVLSKENVSVPESSIDAYRKWQVQKKREIVKAPLPVMIRGQGAAPGPMICNIVPSQI